MAKLRLFETPVQAKVKLKTMFPVLDEILREYCKTVTYWKVYTVNHTTVIFVKNNVETVVLLANPKVKITEAEVAFVKEKLLTEEEAEKLHIPHEVRDKYEKQHNKQYKDIVLLKQYSLD
jgi:hypothetical protein